MLSCTAYAADPEEYETSLNVCFRIYRFRQAYPDALRVALKLNDFNLIDTIMRECKDPSVLKQMALMLARQRTPYKVKNEELSEIIGNQKLSEYYKHVGKDLGVLDPKTVEQIFKSHPEESSRILGAAALNSAKKNLTETYATSFVNMGFGSDALLTTQAGPWFAKNKEGGKFAAAAGLGLIYMWDWEAGMNAIDKYLYIPDDNIIGGAYFALGMVNSGIQSEFDPALQMLEDALKGSKDVHKLGAILGLSFAYAGTCKTEILELLSPIIIDTGYSIELTSMAALCLGIVFMGSCHGDVLNDIMQGITDREPSALENDPLSRFYALALGLVFLGKQDKIDAALEAVKLVPPPLGKFMTNTLIFCAYAGTGNVLKIQDMLHSCGEHLEAKDSLHQIASVIGVAVIAMGEEIGVEMCYRTMNHLLQYGEPTIRKTVPLAIGILSLSNPQIATMDLLTKLTYDPDKEVAQSAIFALGLIGAGTNNSRLAELLRQLASYLAVDNDALFMVRIAQGLLQMGKGLLTIQPLHSDRFLMSNSALAGIITAVFACTNLKNIVYDKYHYLLFYLAMAASPRVCLTVTLDVLIFIVK